MPFVLRRPSDHEVEECHAVSKGNEHHFTPAPTVCQYGYALPCFDKRDNTGRIRSRSPDPGRKASFRAKGDQPVKGERRMIAFIQNESFVGKFADKNASLLC